MKQQTGNAGWWLLIVVVGVILLVILGDDKKPAAPVAPPVNYPVVFVQNGAREVFTNAPLIAPLQIVTPKGPESYYIKLTDARTSATVMTFFLHGGQDFSTEVPLGNFRLKYATGKTWYGESHLFGPDTAYSEADKNFFFSELGGQINGYTVQLIRQQGGNLQTRKISPGSF
jgi:hypothetical protein